MRHEKGDTRPAIGFAPAPGLGYPVARARLSILVARVPKASGTDSLKVLDQAFEAVKTFQPLKSEQIAAHLNKTAQAAENGRFEPFKTTSGFDSTAKHPEWLG